MNGNDDMDEELKAAIAASLEDFQGSAHSRDPTSSKKHNVVDLTADSDDGDEVEEIFPKSRSVIGSETEDGDDYDEDLERAIQISMQGAPEKVEKSDGNEIVQMSTQKEDSPKPISVKNDKKPSPQAQKEEQPTQEQKPSFPGILGLDRKKMEEERLARLMKRKIDTSPDRREAKQSRTESPKGKRAGIKSPHKSPTPKPEPRKEQPKARSVDTPTSTPSVQFPAGVIKKTWNANARRIGNDIKINEVFQASDLELAVLSSFMWDMDWLFSNLDTKKTRFLLIMQAKEESTRRQYEAETAMMPNLRLCFPSMEGQVNCMHSKLMLLFHPGYVRIVIPTANLTSFDWGHDGTMENSVFLIDLPKKTGGNEDTKTAFYEELVYFLKASALHDNIIAKLDTFDFSRTAKYAFVHTIGGSHTGESWRRTGYCGLGRAVNSLGLRTSSPLNIDYVTSSLGSLNDDFLRSIYLAAQGDDGLTEYTARATKSKTTPDSNPHEWKDNRLRVYFPSEQTVKETYGGPNSAGTICFQSSWFNGPKFPSSILRDCASARKGLLMHNKIMYVRPDERISQLNSNTTSGGTCPAWAYIGSANLSESAWGRLVQDRASTVKSNPKPPKLNCRNWECGVIVPVSENEKRPDGDRECGRMLDVFRSTVPVPMSVPGKKYEGDGRLKPWYFMEGMNSRYGGF
ncbi:uncharacterized protein ACHE_50173S [Aspergillus chevalieri]|uniref:PLD phosphodiesterase domain-containing protein n=1 Tax=Aspergillus chevalieri TaxID=182096 RepID=A0A7R7VQI0_ASPCH|nr:uncharacterized protein ACHE_50173S [Aspergillus chevalieri]BCR88975.1 hypothetical protein ACHE_50173S [Aspergillus chevalieri]